ncbi:unnamed protein product, partial [Hymenolepis diminuta]
EPFICKYWHGTNKALLNTKWNTTYPNISFGKARIKVSRLIPSTRQATGGVVSVDKEQFDNTNTMLVGISKGGHPNQLQPIKQLSTYKTIWAKGGFYISSMNVLDMPVVKTVGASGFQPPRPDDQTIILQMPIQRCLGESTEVVFLYGNVVIEAELEVMFHSVPENIQPLDKEQYILGNSIELTDYMGKEGKDLDPVYLNAYIK